MLTAGLMVAALSGCASKGASAPMAGAQTELATTSDQTSAQRRGQIRLELAIGYYEQRQMAVALDELKQALQADPNLADAYSVRALIYMDMGETKLADDNFLSAIRLAPNNADFTSNYGWFLCQNGRVQESITYFETTLKSPSYQYPSKTLNNAGLCSLKLGNEAAAEKYFRQAFQFDPNNASAGVNLGKMHYGRGQYEQARFYTGRLLKADVFSAEVLWLSIKIEHKMGDRAAENSLATQLRRRYPGSQEFAAYQRGAFDE
jgi:type IV pilus assembly protein PilF